MTAGKGNPTSPSAPPNTDILENLLSSVQDPSVLIAFGIGVVLTALLCGLIALCCRCKRKSSLKVSETLEMVTSQELKQSGQKDESTQTHGGAEENGEAACSPEVEYSDIDFSALKRQRTAEDVTRENTESEYAEIKREVTEEREGGEDEEKEDMRQDTLTCEQTEAEALWTEGSDK